MTLEDELGSIMRSHDSEAPGVAALGERPWAAGAGASARRASGRRSAGRRSAGRRSAGRRRLLPLAAAAAVVVVAGGAFAIHRAAESPAEHQIQALDAHAPLVCPKAYDARIKYRGQDPDSATEWVPIKPTGASARDRLVPEQIPQTAVICAYVHHGDFAPNRLRPLTGHRQVMSGLSALRDALASQRPGMPGYCQQYLSSADADNSLIGLTYPGGGVVWVGVPGDHCSGATNGVISTTHNLTPETTAAYQSGTWVARTHG